MSIVQQYTGRHLTVPSDKLFAISAIAETSNDGSTDRYLAGIWMSHLPNGLMWNYKDLRPQIPSTSFVAPSWSWASVRGEITWTRTGDDEHDPQLEVLECSVELASDEAPYGAVKKGTLVFKNLLQNTTIPPYFLRGRAEESPLQASTGKQTYPKLDPDLANAIFDFHGNTLRRKVSEAQVVCSQISL